MDWIDLRSDTVTRPSKKMLGAMCNAEVGDDVLQDDATVKKLEKKAAGIIGKEVALFVPSGTFANQLAILTLTNRGDEVLIPKSNHIHVYEVGAASVISNVQLRLLDSDYGDVDVAELREAFRGRDIHYPRTGLLCLENAHSTGKVIDLQNIKDACDFAKEAGIPSYLDGARIFNAATALNRDVKDIAKDFDAIMFCFSKGLCAPIGSILLGNDDFIENARKNRKMMGGGMRQVGYLAAPCIVALEEMTRRLKDDHDNALYLADSLSKFEQVKVFKDRLDINMVFLTLDDKVDDLTLIKELYKNKIKILGRHNGEYRLVTHYGIEKEDIDRFTDIFGHILERY